MIDILHLESPRVIGTAYVRFESEHMTITKHSLVIHFDVSSVVQMLFYAMTDVTAKIKVLVSHGIYGLIYETIKFMHGGFRCGYLFHKSMKLSLSMYPMIQGGTFIRCLYTAGFYDIGSGTIAPKTIDHWTKIDGDQVIGAYSNIRRLIICA